MSKENATMEKIQKAVDKLLVNPKQYKEVLNDFTDEEKNQVYNLVSQERVKANPEEYMQMMQSVYAGIKEKQQVKSQILESEKKMRENTLGNVLEQAIMRYYVLALILDICVNENHLAKDDYYSKIEGRLPIRFAWIYSSDVFVRCIEELSTLKLIELEDVNNPQKYIATQIGIEEYKKQTYQSLASSNLIGLETIEFSNKSYELSQHSTDLSEETVKLSRKTVQLTKTMMRLTIAMTVLTVFIAVLTLMMLSK